MRILIKDRSTFVIREVTEVEMDDDKSALYIPKYGMKYLTNDRTEEVFLGLFLRDMRICRNSIAKDAGEKFFSELKVPRRYATTPEHGNKLITVAVAGLYYHIFPALARTNVLKWRKILWMKLDCGLKETGSR